MYWALLEKRLGFPANTTDACRVATAGVSFEGRQALLAKLRQHCTAEKTPKVELRPDPSNLYDKDAVGVWVYTDTDNLTKEETHPQQVGFLPKRWCPCCMTSLSGKKADVEICPACSEAIGIGSRQHAQSYLAKWVGQLIKDGKTIQVGIDNVTEAQHTKGNLGLLIWLRPEN